ncbi:DMT family transporter [Roseobacter litoralis]|uniref:Multi-pass membrane protein n=1 Tax=Roseobacter litoralis (strain ATCC 49566 / DSM 6996 / JCM 21268 / NBRC 15278 / OCh 149) TaxID=391595 RepID=F7ZLG6_ROSLO|nr:DMT family transporter [Roseobacter litoralis]AEI92826.1 putative multi-pass membrane protein [Roseobacter litoralis Och 149]
MFQNPSLPGLHIAAPAKPNTGMICMIVAMLLLPVGDTFAKLISETLNPVGVTLCRILAQALFLVPVAYLLRHRLRGAMFSPVVALSGVLLIVSLTSLISAFAVMPITTALAIFFVEPLILTILAAFLLGETAGPRRLAAVGVGLIGAMIVIRPGFDVYGWATLLPLISASAYALNMIVLKKATVTRSGLTVQCGTTIYAGLGLILLSAGLGATGMTAFVPAASDTATWLLILCAGVVAATSFVLIAEAYRSADATALAPFQYLEIVTATALGFLVFGDFPDTLTWIGVAIILGSGIYIFHREGQSDTAAPRRKRAER